MFLRVDGDLRIEANFDQIVAILNVDPIDHKKCIETIRAHNPRKSYCPNHGIIPMFVSLFEEKWVDMEEYDLTMPKRRRILFEIL